VLIPIHPQDRPLLGMQWEDQLYNAAIWPEIGANAALAWHLYHSGIPLISALPGLIGPPNSPQCGASLTILDRECCMLGVPIAAHKREDPATYLGIEINTVAG
jgi:hypothetical protein